MPRAIAVGTRVEQSSEFVSCTSGAGRRHLEDLADSIHRLSSAAEDLQLIIPCSNRTLLLQREFRITLMVSIWSPHGLHVVSTWFVPIIWGVTQGGFVMAINLPDLPHAVNAYLDTKVKVTVRDIHP